VDAALGEWTDAAPLTPTAAQEGVEAEGEGDEPGEGKEQSRGEGQGLSKDYCVPFPEAFIRARRMRNFGWLRRGANSRACLKCSTSCSPAATALSM